MNRETLREGYQNLMGYLYAPGPYYRRIRTFLREYRPAKMSTPLNWRYLMAFFRANFHLGVYERGRFHYWGLLIWTFFRRPRLVPLAVVLSVYGHHFRKTCAALKT
jgi:hypothetical protein